MAFESLNDSDQAQQAATVGATRTSRKTLSSTDEPLLFLGAGGIKLANLWLMEMSFLGLYSVINKTRTNLEAWLYRVFLNTLITVSRIYNDGNDDVDWITMMTSARWCEHQVVASSKTSLPIAPLQSDARWHFQGVFARVSANLRM